MFKHLDPSDEVQPDDRALGLVLERANAIRGRRRQLTIVISCSILLIASIAFFFARSPDQSASAPSDYQFNLRKGPLPIGLPVPATALVDVAFANSQNGFALAVHRDSVILAASTDGGSNWQVRNNQLPATLGPQSDYPGQMEFIGSTGYLWGVQGAHGSPLWVSRDGGRTWKQAPIGPYVFDISAIGPNVWALTSSCSGTDANGPCSLKVTSSPDGATSWRTLGPFQGSVAGTAGAVTQPVELARITTNRAYVLSYSPSPYSEPASWQLYFTDNAGANWSTRPVPCDPIFRSGAEVAASSTSDLWLLCGGTADSQLQIKELYRSSDGGRSWQLTSTTSGQVWPMSVAPTNPLPPQGFVAPLESGHRNLAVASATTAWLYPARGELYKTTDGGVNWLPVSDLAQASIASGGQGNAAFLSPTQGWICAFGVGLWRTTDGIHWYPLGQS